MHWCCPNCKAVGTMKKEAIAGEKRVLITCEGKICTYVFLCINCTTCN